MMPTNAAHRLPTMLVVFVAAVPVAAQSWLPPSPLPTWGAAAPASIVTLTHDPSLSATANGQRLHTALGVLQPGQGLAVGPGVWSVPQRLDLHGTGTPQAPLWLFAANPAQRPVITRPDAAQNVINVGSNGPARYWVLRDLDVTGGADLVRLYDCAHVWIDRCRLHDGGGVGIAANSTATDHLWLTRNEIVRPGPNTTGEGIYLGGNNGTPVTSWSVIAWNHVHDLRSAVLGQGDGIELKQGSHHNWIVGNVVSGCRNPCILVYGTGGNAQNVVEGNVCYDSDDAALQVQGEAIVRNNLVLGGATGFSSHDHQGQSRDLQFVHNTVVCQYRGASMQAWQGRPGMVFANNVVYSLTAEAVYFGNGSAGVQIAGNVVRGPVQNAGAGFVAGLGMQDFVDLSLSPWRFDATPRVGGPIDNRGSAVHTIGNDLLGAARTLPADPGAIPNRATLSADVDHVSPVTGGVQSFTFDAAPLAGSGYVIVGSISGTSPGAAYGPFTIPLNPDAWWATTLSSANSGGLQQTLGVLDAQGRAFAALHLPPLPAALHGVTGHHALIALQGGTIVHVSNPVPITLQ